MNNLSNTIFKTYLSHFSTLAQDKQFHLTSRLYLWCQEPGTRNLLERLRPAITGNEDPELALRVLLERSKTTQTHGSKNAAELRQPFFEKYPDLKLMVIALFRIVFLKTIYGIEAAKLLYRFFKEEDVNQLSSQLLDDPEALAILSTHAINFLYLLGRFVKPERQIDPEVFLAIGRSQYDFTNKLHLQLYIYLYTHCIIGESQFYYRAIPYPNLSVYHTMVDEMETVIEKYFEDINLDNKFEFLVSAKIVHKTSKLEGRIFNEALLSKASDGNFLIDRYNNNPQTANTTLESSEHRNVLFIMASRDFTPLG